MSLINQTATELLTQLRDESLTPLDLLDALEQRIAEVDGVVNALPTRCFDRARSVSYTHLTLPTNREV